MLRFCKQLTVANDGQFDIVDGESQMGRPVHYSLDIVARCQSLLTHLMPFVMKGLPDDARFDGSLTTTFLLALSTPIIVLPVERIFNPSQGNVGLGDDSDLNKDLSAEVKKVLGGNSKFGDAPFFTKGDWSYLPDQNLFNIANNWPIDVLKGLGSDNAVEAARSAGASTIIRHLRNALAHGNITYLDKNGGVTEGAAAMYGFASAKIDRQQKCNPKIVGLHTLRVSEGGFGRFVTAWAAWIEKAGVAEQLNNKRVLDAAK